MFGELKENVALQYLAWVSYPIILVVFASLFCHLVSPQAIGLCISYCVRPLIPFFITLYYVCLSSVLYSCIPISILVICSQCHKLYLCLSVQSSVLSYYALNFHICLLFVLNPPQPPTTLQIFVPSFQDVIITVSFSLTFSHLPSPQLF